MINQYERIGKRICMRRKELRIRQSQLAELLNISNNHLSSIENGREKPSMDVFMQICIILDVSPDFILFGNMHVNDVPRNIADNLRLCKHEDMVVISELVELMAIRNQNSRT